MDGRIRRAAIASDLLTVRKLVWLLTVTAADPQMQREQEKDVWLHIEDGGVDATEHWTIGMMGGR